MTDETSFEAQRDRVDWTIPQGKPDWLFGTGVTKTEKNVVWATVVAGAMAVAFATIDLGVDWTWWQWLVVFVVVFDVVGGVPANSLGTAKRLYANDPVPGGGLAQRFALDHVLFTAAHVHLFVVALMFGAEDWAWAGYWYGIALGSVIVIRRVPVYLQRPSALAVFTVALIGSGVIVGPAGLAWLGPVLALKLLVAHAVTEAPFRPLPPR